MDTAALLELVRPVIDVVGDYPNLKALLVLAGAFAMANLTSFIISKLISKLVERTGNTFDDAVASLLRVPVYWTVIIVGCMMGAALLTLNIQVIAKIHNAFASILILIWCIFFVRVVRKALKIISDNAGPHTVIRPQTLPLFNNIAVVVVLALGIYLVFDAWNIDMTAWLASAGIIGIAVGFAAKDTLANLFAGVFILADAPYKIGDYVVLDSGERGKVTHIGIRSTRILTRDDVEVTIPNSVLGSTRVTNESGGRHEKFRIRVPVGVSYESDIDQVRALLEEIGRQEPQVCKDPEPRVRFRRFGASSLDFELLCWVDNPELKGRVVDVLNTAIYKRFKAEKVEIPYSKHDVYIKEFPTLDKNTKSTFFPDTKE
ncbi:MAG: mechanosensitive ion channel family protein [Gammaproteobacteria bacterium]|nr:mechanosensitive ion channel family protein [Gammaproteobacteria bacterium]